MLNFILVHTGATFITFYSTFDFSPQFSLSNLTFNNSIKVFHLPIRSLTFFFSHVSEIRFHNSDFSHKSKNNSELRGKKSELRFLKIHN